MRNFVYNFYVASVYKYRGIGHLYMRVHRATALAVTSPKFLDNHAAKFHYISHGRCISYPTAYLYIGSFPTKEMQTAPSVLLPF